MTADRPATEPHPWENHDDSCWCHITICQDCGCTNEIVPAEAAQGAAPRQPEDVIADAFTEATHRRVRGAAPRTEFEKRWGRGGHSYPMVRQPKPGDSLPEHSPWIFDEAAASPNPTPQTKAGRAYTQLLNGGRIVHDGMSPSERIARIEAEATQGAAPRAEGHRHKHLYREEGDDAPTLESEEGA